MGGGGGLSSNQSSVSWNHEVCSYCSSLLLGYPLVSRSGDVYTSMGMGEAASFFNFGWMKGTGEASLIWTMKYCSVTGSLNSRCIWSMVRATCLSVGITWRKRKSTCVICFPGWCFKV